MRTTITILACLCVSNVSAKEPLSIEGLIAQHDREEIINEYNGRLNNIQRAFLNEIATYESNQRYNVRYSSSGPIVFDKYEKHPSVCEPITNPKLRGYGRCSTAAGKYQITKSTWDYYVKLLAREGVVITDFSPKNQDKVAWEIAARVYHDRTERDLLDDLRSKGRTTVLLELRGTWEGLNKL